MISFITWVNNQQEYRQFQQSVKCPDVEFIEIDQKAQSLSDAYEFGQWAARGDIKVYCHQDIIIHDPMFCEKLTALFENQKYIGFVGVIGNTKRNNDCWWTTAKQNLRGYVRQTDKTGQRKQTVFDFGRGTFESCQMDGLLLATDKQWEFPAELPGIHFLDLWMCNLAIEQGLKNYILHTDIEHTSWGETDSKEFAENRKIYLNRWRI